VRSASARDDASIPFARVEITEEAQAAAAAALASGWVTTGPEVARFEGELAEWIGVDHAVAVSSCTAAIEIALRALRLAPGSKVLTSTMTFCGAVHAIVHAGLRPVLADVDQRTLMPDGETTERAVRRAGGVDAMVVVHFGGHPARVEALAAAAGLPLDRVVEDAAHAIGAVDGAKRVGTISAATCFSFYATKNLPIGEGGMLTTANPDIADVARQVRLHGMSVDAWRRYLPGASWRYEVAEDGIKANMTDVAAAIGRAQLRHLFRWQRRREDIATLYDRNLNGVAGLERPTWPVRGRHAWHLYVVRVSPPYAIGRDELVQRLAERGIGSSVHFVPVHQLAYFRELLAPAPGDFPAADAAAEGILSLPIYPALADDQVDRVSEQLAELGCRSPRRGVRPSTRTVVPT
jgi:dTDP-4-amino-4,6-dideoxygalactose transaminase